MNKISKLMKNNGDLLIRRKRKRKKAFVVKFDKSLKTELAALATFE